MSIAKEFTNWQKKKTAELAKYTKSSPALVSLVTYLTVKFGGANLGIYGVRNVRGGKELSSHSFGSALDWSYRNLNRQIADAAIDFMIANSEELGIQAIHDYLRCRIWRANRSSDKNGGWQKQRPDKHGMGWGDWLHVEVNERQWADGRSVEEKLFVELRPILKSGDKGDLVRSVQTTLRNKAGQNIVIDGIFGTQTEMAIRNVQAFVTQGKGPVTGIVDSEFWKIIDILNKQ